LLALTMLAMGAPAAFLAGPVAAVSPGDPAVTGRFSAPFEEAGGRCVTSPDGEQQCKPAAGSIVTLPNGKIIYWDALDSVQEAKVNAVAEFGDDARNDMARVLDLRSGAPVFTSSNPNSSIDPAGREGEYLPGGLFNDDEKRNDGDLFCSDQLFLADGTVLNVGGTQYYQEPGVPGMPDFGVVELEGLTNSRLYDPESDIWTASGEMTYGRWYPSVLTLPDGDVMAFSGVTKLIKPIYPDRPADSGRNVVQSERYDPATQKWTVDGGNRSMPLYPRMHLLPNGNAYYDAGGQTFNPAGQAYDEALWNTTASYNPQTKTWRDLGLPQFGPALVGFRGSAFSQMLPLRPNAAGEYDTVRTLSAGGVYGVSPGTYVGTDTSTLNTITLGPDGRESFASEATDALNNARWYSTGVSLPTGEVIAFSGADRDEVVAPGSGTPETTPEIFDPKTGTWTELADADRGRTYHNSATLLTDGRVLVGGHSPITTGYAVSTDVLEKTLGFSNPNRDPSFEIFEPPNLFYGPRPVITELDPTVKRGRTMVLTSPDAGDASSVTLVRNTAMTHLVDSDQRTVELPIVARDGDRLTVDVTDNAAVLPDGPYIAFVNKQYDKGETPSVGRQVFVGAVPARFADDIAANNTATVASELASRGLTARAAAAPAPADVAPAAARPAA
ncbi:MAG: DUF1929 domain-containing protein, partial [Actinomycetota bacterium]|nr:DUF1929 domain-containing protein [Actinomycetota bacterium]